MKNKAAAAPTGAPVEPRMYAIPAAAIYLGSTQWFVRTLVYGRKLPYRIFGKRIVFDRADLDRFIDGQKVRAA